MGQIAADAAEHVPRALVAFLRQFLHRLQLFGWAQLLRQLNARLRRQQDHRVLGEILASHAVVSAPLILGSALLQIHRGKGQLVDPAENPFLPVHISGGLARAHSDAQHRARVQAHGSGQGGHVAVVRHCQRHVPDFLRRPQIDALDLFKPLLRHLDEQGADHGPVVHDHAGRTDADGVHPRHLGRRRFEGFHDALILVVRILAQLREPDHLFAVDRFPVDHRRDLPVGASGVKADPASAQMAAQADGLLALGREMLPVAQQDLKGFLVHRFHEVGVKRPLSAPAEMLPDLLSQLVAAAEIDPVSAHAVQQELDRPLQPAEVRFLPLSVPHLQMEHAHPALFPLHRDVHGAARLFLISLQPGSEGDEPRIQNRTVFDLQRNPHVTHGSASLFPVSLSCHPGDSPGFSCFDYTPSAGSAQRELSQSA